MKTLIQLIKGVVFYSLLSGAILAPILTAASIDAGRYSLAFAGFLVSFMFIVMLLMFTKDELKDWSGYNNFKHWCNESN